MVKWLLERVRSVINSLTEKAIVAAILAIAVVAVTWGRRDVTLPLGVHFGLALVIILAVLVAQRRGISRSAASQIADLRVENALYGYYATMLLDVLNTMQLRVRGDLQGVGTEAFVEQGILEPARELLRQAPGEDVRLSVLVPEGADFRMKWMAGHRLPSKHAFRLTIAGSFSHIAYSSGRIAFSHDVEDDHRFQAHPRAERPYATIVSVPIKSGEEVVAVFNVVSTVPYAFTDPDYVFIALVGAIVGVAWSLPDDLPGEAIGAVEEGHTGE